MVAVEPQGSLEDLVAKVELRTARVVVVGQGYVGLPLAMASVEAGFPTVGFEIDERRCEMLKAGTSFVEDIADEQLQRALAGKYRPTSELGDLRGFDIAVVTVPTPLRDGAPDLSYVSSAGEQLARVLRVGALVVLESTTYPGTTEELLLPILEKSGLRCGTDFYLGYSPERIDPGNPTWNLANTPKVVSGVDEPSLEAVSAFYEAVIDEVVPVETTATAELVKILENTYRHVNIALVNEVAMFARQLDVNVWAAIDAAASKPFGFTAFRPGPGVGGHCLPIDPSYLSWRVRQNVGQPFRFVELANDVNEHMPDYVTNRVAALLNTHRLAVNGTKVLLLGLTYKAGTSDWRESPSLVVAEQLANMGAELALCDPHVSELTDLGLGSTRMVEFGPEELAAADLVVVLVDHPEFDPATIVKHAKLVFDSKAILRGHDFNGELL